MQKKIACLVLSAATLLGLACYSGARPAAAAELTEKETATAAVETAQISTARFLAMEEPKMAEGPHYLVNGAATADSGMTVSNGVTSVSVGILAKALYPDAAVNWDGATLTVNTGSISLTATVGAPYYCVNGRYFYMPAGVPGNGSGVYLPLRQIAHQLGAAAEWNQAAGLAEVHTTTGSFPSGAEVYREDDVYWLSHIIFAESGNQSLAGMIAVGTVIMNRVGDSRFPNTIKGVITAPGQFTPVSNGTIHKTPSNQAVIAAKLVLEGAREAGNSLYFVNPRGGLSRWFRSLTPVTTIGDHAFFVN